MPGTVLLTGASSGLGLETAVLLAKRGFRVAGTMRDPAKRAELDRAASAAGVTVDVVPMDLNDAESIHGAVEETIAKYGPIDALVNNAGYQIRGFFEDTSAAEIRRVFETNVFGTMEVTRAVLPHMRTRRQGRIVFVTSIAGRIGSLGLGPYSATKFALEGFGETLALEVAPFGISVSLVEPGVISTPFWSGGMLVAAGAKDPASPNRAFFAESERMAEWAVKSSPIKPADVAQAVYRALSSARPMRRYLVGTRPKALMLVRRLVPAEMFERIYSKAVVGQITKAARPNS
jgi:NAD(P)-dependent dehydrogenase (short-subunit alcohol dehydrogenase family)